MKRWVDTNRELPPLEQKVKVKCEESYLHGKLLQDKDKSLWWKFDEIGGVFNMKAFGTLMGKMGGLSSSLVFWEEEFDPIETRWEILDIR
jgi:hypothetical protein